MAERLRMWDAGFRPGVWGTFIEIDERELIKGHATGTFE
jgi:hypothetical protein